MITRHSPAYYVVYVLENSLDFSWYIGFTRNLKKRIYDHNHGKCLYTRNVNGVWKLIYAELYLNKKDALGREKFLKSGSGRRFLKKQMVNYLSKN